MAASTGSPASRRSTKLTPFTTRPSLTSRQGITRTLNIGKLLGRGARVTDQSQRSGRIEAAIVKRPARDRTGKLFGARRQQCPHIVDGSKATGGNHRDRYPLRKRNRSVEIETLEETVPRDIGEDDGGYAGILETLGYLKRGNLRGLCPAVARDL